MRFKFLILAALVAFGYANNSEAAVTIKNIGDQPQTLVVEQLGSKREVTIPAHGVYQRNGVGVILHREGKRPIIAHDFAVYSIWPDGDIHIQRYEGRQQGTR